MSESAPTPPWPVWGLMQAVHADNAKEFHSRMLHKACKNYGIDLRWRPVAQPHYGGHIERLLGIFNHDIHTLPGTTFSHPAARGAYDADKKAALTLSEFERWLTMYITEIYHQRVHRTLGMPPMVGVGTHEALRAIQTDPQLASRFTPVPVPRWRMGREFLMLLASFELVLPLRQPSRLIDARVARQLLMYSEGSLGELAALLTTAAIYAIKNEIEHTNGTVLAAIDWVPPSARRRQAERRG